MASDELHAADTEREQSADHKEEPDRINDNRATDMHAESTGRYFGSLDVTRTMLALIVAIGHYFYFDGKDGHIPQSFILAVDFFFVLSGFVLTQSTFNFSGKSCSDFLRHFATRRLFRLMPLYLLALVATAAVQYAQYGASIDSFYYFAISALMLQDMGFAKGATHLFVGESSMGVGWSVSVEMWVGLAFFPLVYLLRRNRSALVYCCASIAIVCAATLVNLSPNFLGVHYQQLNGFLTFGAIRCALGLSLGCITYLAYNAIKSTPLNSVVWSSLEVTLVITCVLLYGRMSYSRQNEFIAPVLFSALIFVFARQRGVLSQLLSATPIAPLRPLSYAIYMVHPLVIVAFRFIGWKFDWHHAVVYFAALFVLSLILHQLVEKPGIRFGRQQHVRPQMPLSSMTD